MFFTFSFSFPKVVATLSDRRGSKSGRNRVEIKATAENAMVVKKTVLKELAVATL
jgi:hypothetical protein